MKKKLVIILILILLLPMIAIGILGVKVARDDSALIDRQRSQVISDDLSAAAMRMDTVLTRRAQEFHGLCRQPDVHRDALLNAADTQPFVRQFFVIDKNGKLTYPALDENATDDEKAFMDRTAHLWSHRFPFRSRQEDTPADGGSGFKTFYRNRGLQFIYWSGRKNGQVIGFEVEKTMLIADLIDALSQAEQSPPAEKQIRLIAENGNTVYQYGGFSPRANMLPVMEKTLPAPFASWRLQYFAPPVAHSTGLTTQTIILLLIIGIGLLMVLGLGAYFLMATNRASRLATQQVNFVNQVSHELKTPLTNIRLYAELLAEQLDEDDERQQRYIENITSESQRLGRLIQNVLSFARSNRSALQLKYSNGRVDDVIADTLIPFRASLERLAIRVETDFNAADDILLDQDLVKQVLTNLISNVEKYAADGNWLRIQSLLTGTEAKIIVSDKGPGIRAHQKEMIFAPFTRLDNKITEGATGTGIGLSISRALARLHGGDVVLQQGDTGAVFEFGFSVKRDDV